VNIPNEAVEAAYAAHLAHKPVRRHGNAKNAMRAALEAAATYLTERAYNAGHLDGMTGAPNNNPYRSQP
jgi:hypothetical protein